MDIFDKIKDSPSCTFIELDSCDSTNDFIKQHGKQILKEIPLIVTSREQLKGRGRDNRKWFSPKGKGLYISIGLLMGLEEKFNLLSLISGLAVSATLKAVSDVPFKLKWPNDVLFENKKIAGILIENSFTASQTVSIIGMGVNLNQNATDFPPGLREKAISLKMISGQPVDMRLVTSKLVNVFFRWLAFLKAGDRETIITEANRVSAFSPGKEVVFHLNGKPISGIYREINGDGGLILEDKTGKKTIYYSGEIDI